MIALNTALISFEIKGESSIYLLSPNDSFKHMVPEKYVQVEFLENHVYCLLPSIGSSIGSVRIFSRMPEFIKDLSFHLFLGKVNYQQR